MSEVQTEPKNGPSDDDQFFEIDSSSLLRRLFVLVLSCEVAFFVADIFLNRYRWFENRSLRKIFNTTREDSLANWFGSTQTFLIGLTLFAILWILYRQGVSLPRRLGWLLLACFFTYLAVDDGAKIHERVGSAFKASQKAAVEAGEAGTFAAKVQQYFPSYDWQIIFVPIFGPIGIFMCFFLAREFPDLTSRLLVVGAVATLAFAVGLDFFEGMDWEHRANVQRFFSEATGVQKDSVSHYSKSIEETLEMLSMSIMWIVFLRHFTRITGDLRLRFSAI